MGELLLRPTAGAIVGEGFKAIVLPRLTGAAHRRPHAFVSFAAALPFIETAKECTVLIEFSVDLDTLDFYDAMKAIGVPVIFSANRLDTSQFSQFGIRAIDVVYPERRQQTDNFADFRPRPGITRAASNITLITSTVF
jgi:hypothetical protein